MAQDKIIAIDSKGNQVTETLKFDKNNMPVFDDFLHDGMKMEHGIYLLDNLWRNNSLFDFQVLHILDEIAGKRIPFDNRVAIVNLIVGATLDIWSKKGHHYLMDSIFNKIKTVQAETLLEASKAPEREKKRILEMDKVIEAFKARDARAAQIQSVQGRQ